MISRVQAPVLCEKEWTKSYGQQVDLSSYLNSHAVDPSSVPTVVTGPVMTAVSIGLGSLLSFCIIVGACLDFFLCHSVFVFVLLFHLESIWVMFVCAKRKTVINQFSGLKSIFCVNPHQKICIEYSNRRFLAMY